VQVQPKRLDNGSIDVYDELHRGLQFIGMCYARLPLMHCMAVVFVCSELQNISNSCQILAGRVVAGYI
jgi:hypothetical protein